ncbi:hypothetical protein BDR03DRAFT_950856 [Suillus americanus]|nr:hypothetical protein BDR03DRAFT_950856 [Suillus americanus]
MNPTALAHFCRRFKNLCTTLLKNDSLPGMSDRSLLYFQSFQWFKTPMRQDMTIDVTLSEPLRSSHNVMCISIYAF